MDKLVNSFNREVIYMQGAFGVQSSATLGYVRQLELILAAMLWIKKLN
jgi:hypothetical protein